MARQYVIGLDGEPHLEPDLLIWGRWMQTAHLSIAFDSAGSSAVSTIFLGLDHSHGDDGPPVLWETMVRGGSRHGYQQRYTSREDALIGHAEVLRMLSS